MSQENWVHVREHFGWNSSAAHPETLLYCGLFGKYSTDEDRLDALRLTLGARERERDNPQQGVRKYIYPPEFWINFDAETPMGLLNFDEFLEVMPWYITEGPLSKDFLDGELIEICQAALGPDGIPPLEYLTNETLVDGDQSHAKLGKLLSLIKSHSMDNEAYLIISNYYLTKDLFLCLFRHFLINHNIFTSFLAFFFLMY